MIKVKMRLLTCLIGPHVWIGGKSIILPRADIGVGSVVSGKKIPEYSVLVGNPAKIVNKRV